MRRNQEQASFRLVSGDLDSTETLGKLTNSDLTNLKAYKINTTYEGGGAISQWTHLCLHAVALGSNPHLRKSFSSKYHIIGSLVSPLTL